VEHRREPRPAQGTNGTIGLPFGPSTLALPLPDGDDGPVPTRAVREAVDERRPAGAVLGLTEAEAMARRAERTEDDGAGTSRSYADIVRATVLTRFNAILGCLLVVILVVGPIQDALFGIVLVTNAAVGIVQEIRAKRSLDRLSVVTAPTARVRRNGREREVPVGDVVAGDVVRVAAGDQIAVDGELLTSDHLEVDESLLTGEADAVEKQAGEDVLSGSFVVAGGGTFVATRVGRDAYARSLAIEARAFTLVHSELRSGIDRILRLVTWLLLPTAGLLVTSQLVTHDSLPAAIRGSVAGVGSMIPEGLVLLTSIAFAASVVRLADRHVLVQDLAAVEILARVDVVCIDKTGTLTEPDLEVTAIDLVGDADRPIVGRVLETLSTVDAQPNATLRAIGRRGGETAAIEAVDAVPFSSARKWSAFTAADGATWILGAPELVIGPHDPDGPWVLDAVGRHASKGRRVVLLARSDGHVDGDRLPKGRRAVALVVLEEVIRPDAADTIDYFRREGVTVKVISGDHPMTVGAVAARCGLDVDGEGAVVDARTLPPPEAERELEDVVERATVFGRVTPHQKRDLVHALQRRGHVVAMTGDGVNDVLALKAADLGVAMASGTPATRAVAPLVLMTNAFDALPSVVVEGRRVIANVERVASLFLTKTVYAFLLAVAVGVARLPFPFLPRHLTIVSSLTIGIPAFFLALAPNAARSQPGFVVRALRFAVPAGAVAATATFGAYALVRTEPGTTLIESRTAATLTLFGVGLWVLTILARPWTSSRKVLVTSMVLAFIATTALPPVRTFFELDLPRPVVAFAAVGVVAAANVALELGWQLAHVVERAVRERAAQR
jgi:cation-transporting ATPase E